MNSNSLAVLYKSLSEITDNDWAVIEAKKAERAQRLAELVQSDVWKLDLYPIFRRVHDDYLEAVKRKELDPDALKAFDEILNQIDGTIRVGAGSMERLAAKRAKAVEIQTRMNQRQNPSSLADDGLSDA